VARHVADKRSIQSESASEHGSVWIDVVSRDPTPAEAACAADQLESLLERLSEAERDIVVHRLQGWSNEEIAAKLGVSDRTVRRALSRIREHADSLLHETPTIEAPAAGLDEIPQPSQSRNIASLAIPRIDDRSLLVQQFVGQGAFGKVYRATDRQTGQTVAVKFLGKRFWQHKATLERFESEIALLSRLHHPNIVAIHGSGRTLAGAPFFVMEYVDGWNLSAWRKARSPSVAEIVAVVNQVARGVSAAHSGGVIHGDLTPSNVLLERSTERVALTDFGFSRVTQQQRFAMLGGTPGFLAPEQVSDAFGEISIRTDVYGIGGILYSLLTGQPPCAGESLADVIARVLSSRPPSFAESFQRDIPAVLAALTLACLAKEPSDRPGSADAVARQLQEISAG
jgi:serine/threonine protein kinase